jgi:pimeloyl-ACP methyl ester carboxylesterase
MEGILHAYIKKPALNLFEYTPRHPTTPSTLPPTPPNILLFIGGLYDNFSSPPYLIDLAQLFPRHNDQQWALMHVQLSSAMKGFGTSDISQDIEEIGLAITFIRDVIRKGQPTNVVLLGQSTGCQDTLHYISAPNTNDALRPIVQGAILQAPLSDRDALMVFKVNKDPERKALFERCMHLIATIPKDEHNTYLLPLAWTMPLFGRAPLCVSRFLDLASPSSPENPRQEDFFSHDLHESRLNETFGQVGARQVLGQAKAAQPSVLILISESDEVASQPVTAQDLLRRWEKALASDSAHSIDLHGESMCIKDATHDISGESPAQQMAKLVSFRGAVLQYIDDVVGGVDKLAFGIYGQGKDKIRQLEEESAAGTKL